MLYGRLTELFGGKTPSPAELLAQGGGVGALRVGEAGVHQVALAPQRPAVGEELDDPAGAVAQVVAREVREVIVAVARVEVIELRRDAGAGRLAVGRDPAAATSALTVIALPPSIGTVGISRLIGSPSANLPSAAS